MAFDIRPLPPVTSSETNLPEMTLHVDDPTVKILCGGAMIDYKEGAGSLLTASYPKDLQTWYAKGKDHETPSPATITVYALGLYDPNNEWMSSLSRESVLILLLIP